MKKNSFSNKLLDRVEEKREKKITATKVFLSISKNEKLSLLFNFRSIKLTSN
jgi:hypothetical protein